MLEFSPSSLSVACKKRTKLLSLNAPLPASVSKTVQVFPLNHQFAKKRKSFTLIVVTLVPGLSDSLKPKKCFIQIYVIYF